MSADVVTVVPAEGRTRLRRAHWYRQPTLIVGLVLLAAIVFMCVAAPLLASFDPDKQNLEQALSGAGQFGHLLGTDQEGRDTWARLLYGGATQLPTLPPGAFRLNRRASRRGPGE